MGILVHYFVHDTKNMKSKYKTIGSLLLDSGEEKVERVAEGVKYRFGQTVKDSMTRAETDSTGTMRSVRTWA